ncbi:MAG: replication initiation protein, partial [Campylobacterales bacterium]|nr:replication initiation protein [Campylobacterales bacterium]
MLIYANFKTKVLDVAVAEINKFSDKEVSYKALKKIRKKVIAIRFEIKKNWLDLKAFIEFIREYYPNRRLYIYKGGYVACSLKGMLYYYDVENRPTLSKEAARKCWEYLHENRTKLDIFQPTLF